MNAYSQVTAALESALSAALTPSYSGLVVVRAQFKPDLIPSTFTRYGLFISPSSRPWDERHTGIREVQYIIRADLIVLVANFDPTNALFGTTSPNKGLFELVGDIKSTIRGTTLGSVLDKTYAEAAGNPADGGGGGVEFQELAVAGLDAGSYAVINRANVPFVGRIAPACFPKAT
jgi:hypothetical protein